MTNGSLPCMPELFRNPYDTSGPDQLRIQKIVAAAVPGLTMRLARGGRNDFASVRLPASLL